MIFKFYILPFIFFNFLAVAIVAQQEDFNVTLLAQEDYDTNVSDIWGYVDDNGIEYSLMGLGNGIVIHSLADPSDPQEILYVEGDQSVWRDIKTFGHYGYVIADQGDDGLLVMDLSDPLDSIPYSYYVPVVDSEELGRAHNIYIDERGLLYMSGATPINDGGVLIFDLNADPWQPPLIGRTRSVYSHDNFVRDNILYSAEIFGGWFAIYDVTDPSDPQLLAEENTTRRFTHNNWLSDNSDYIFTTDERADAYVEAYDISDLGDIELLDRYQPLATDNMGVIPHNVLVENDFLTISFYVDGLKIVDAHRPSNLIEVGSFDTYDGNRSGFHGAWGVYPFLPSGIILVSDIEGGLFVLDPEYERAAYVEGVVYDSATLEPVNNVLVDVELPVLPALTETDGLGRFQTGAPHNGPVVIHFSHPFYEDTTIQVEMEQGEALELEVIMVPLYEVVNFNGIVIDSVTEEPIEGAKLLISNEEFEFTLTTNVEGKFSRSLIGAPTDMIVGKWGYKEKLVEQFNPTADSLVIKLSPGYRDYFNLDLGWDVNSTASSGAWVRGEPVGTSSGGVTINPGEDSPEDFGNIAYITGNAGGGAGDDDVDDGEVILNSPVFDLRNYGQPELNFSYWFNGLDFGGRPFDDTLAIYLKGSGLTELLFIETVPGEGWRHVTLDLYDIIDTITELHYLQVVTSDREGTPNVIEAGFDAFEINDLSDLGTFLPGLKTVTVYPNPVKSLLTISAGIKQFRRTEIFHISGRKIYEADFKETIDLNNLPQGQYLLRITDAQGIFHYAQIMKID